MKQSAKVVINTPLKLRCGLTLKNRLAKGAMAESLCNPKTHNPNERFVKLYKAWAEGGIGLQLTGHIMIDKNHKAFPGDPAIHKDSDIEQYKKFASASKLNNTYTIVQLNHPGRQCPNSVNKQPVSPSNVPLKIPGQENFSKIAFKQPRELTEKEIEDIINKFASAAEFCKKVGFNGVEIHGAHGYLISQFLSPLTNLRKDKWGGSLENRKRLLFEIIKQVRRKVGYNNFILGLKINSADFQKGGFTYEDSANIIRNLDSSNELDFVELSGGTYEKSVAVTGLKESSKKREGFFQEFSENLRKSLKQMPLMVTGGFRTVAGMNSALKEGIDLIGIGRPLCLEPDLPKRLLSGKSDKAKDYKYKLEQSVWYHQHQIYLISEGKPTNPEYTIGTFKNLKLTFTDYLWSTSNSVRD